MRSRFLLVGLLLMASMALLLVTLPALAQPDPIVFATATPPADEAGIPVDAMAVLEEETEPASEDDDQGEPRSVPAPVDDVPMVSAEVVNLLFDRWSQTNNITYFVLIVVVLMGGYGLYRSSPLETQASIKREVSAGAGSFLRRLSETDLVPGTSIDEELFDWLYQKYEAKRKTRGEANAAAYRAQQAGGRTPVHFTPSGSPLYPPDAKEEDHQKIGKFG